MQSFHVPASCAKNNPSIYSKLPHLLRIYERQLSMNFKLKLFPNNTTAFFHRDLKQHNIF